MARILVHCPARPTPFGITAPASMEALRQKLAEVTKLEDDTKIMVMCKGKLIELIDIDFLRDEDEIYLGSDCSPSSSRKWLRLNVGGRIFLTDRATLEMKAPDSMLARMFASPSSRMSACDLDSDGALIIDRTPIYFEPVLNFLRTGNLTLDQGVNPQGVLEEARYFGIDALLPQLEQMSLDCSRIRDEAPLTRRDVIDLIAGTPSNRELRFQGVDFSGADLSKLDLRECNFKYANLSRCKLNNANLSFCNLERAVLSNSVMDGAQLVGVKMLCAVMEEASLKGCNFEDPAGSQAVMEGVNLRGAVLEGSSMARVNLRVATIKHGNLKNCDLRGAVLAGADLESCNLTGSDLQEANLRGANFKDTTLELMQTPLHMSQTIR